MSPLITAQEAFMMVEKQERQGAPQTTDDGNLAIVEFVVEEQRGISPLIQSS